MKEKPATAELKAEIVLLTPDLAQEWIRYNVGNRKVKPRYVERLAGAMRRGEYIAGAAMPVAFSGTPEDPQRLLNGQHHLHAVLESGESVSVIVVWGLPEVASTVMDQGQNRSLGDTLQMDGEPYSSYLATALRAVFNHRATGVIGRSPQVQPTTTQLLGLLESEPRIRESTVLCARLLQEGRVFGTRMIMPFHYHLLKAGMVEQADEFLRRLLLGIDVEFGDPIYKVRRWYMEARGRSDGVGTYQAAALIIKAWNAWVTGAEVRQLSFRAGGSDPEQFPTIIIPGAEE